MLPIGTNLPSFLSSSLKDFDSPSQPQVKHSNLVLIQSRDDCGPVDGYHGGRVGAPFKGSQPHSFYDPTSGSISLLGAIFEVL